MKRIIIIALVAFASAQVQAQHNNKSANTYDKTGLSEENIRIREAYLNSVNNPVVAKEAVKGDKDMYLRTKPDNQQSPKVQVTKQKSDLDVRLETITQSGTQERR